MQKRFFTDINSDPMVLNGRNFSREELLQIQETIGMFPKLSRLELAKTICEHLSWFKGNGKYKVESCAKILERMDHLGFIQLPLIRTQYRGSREKIILTDRTKSRDQISGTVRDLNLLVLKPAETKKTISLWNEYVQRYHQLGYKRPFGAHQRYFIVSLSRQEDILGCLLFAASAWSLESRDQWIGWDIKDKEKRLHLIVNNTRFLLFPWVQVKYLASRVLSLAAKRLPIDWQRRYGYRPVLLESFVDSNFYKGVSYKAANWQNLGLTKGRGRNSCRRKPLISKKFIYVYPLNKNFRSQLRGVHHEQTQSTAPSGRV